MLPRGSLPNPHFRSPQTFLHLPPSTATTNQSAPNRLQHNHPQPQSHQRPYMGLANLSLYSSSVSSMDPASVDFRAFYPYTPNEVKHRKRTTSAQLKILENIFKRDTKPNATLRNELAMQLDMTARGVQVWFQNRRAKEKIKAGKVSVNGKTSTAMLPGDVETANHTTPPPSLDDTETPSDTTTDAHPSPSDSENSEVGKPELQESVPAVPSPPQLHVLTTSCNDLRTNTFIEPSGHYNDFTSAHMLAARRGSLPVNVYPQPQSSTDGPPHVDFADPLARRRSVDASLHRLASNPYAPLARAKNGFVFGSRFPGYPPSRHQQRLGVPQSRTGLPYSLEMRRASMDSRGIRFPQTGLSPSPSPLSPAHAVRASLPDQHHLYAISSRIISSPIPGPLPSPGFSFGAATTQSSSSPTSADSERNSPDSFSSFNFRGEDTEDDDASVSYDALSRFGSIASIATSESSINSAYYPETAGCIPDHESRRDSCASGHFLGLMSGLDVNGMPRRSGVIDVLANHTTYVSHEGPHATEAPAPGGSNSTSTNSEHVAYPSPTSTISPGSSPHVQNLASSAVTTVPISRSSELAFALQSQSDQSALENQASFAQPPSPTSGPGIHAGSSTNPSTFYSQHASHIQMLGMNTTPSSLDFAGKYQYDPNSVVGHSHYAPYSTLGDGYAVEANGTITQHMDFNRPQNMSDMYSAYAETGDNSAASRLTQGMQNVESYVTYS